MRIKLLPLERGGLNACRAALQEYWKSKKPEPQEHLTDFQQEYRLKVYYTPGAEHARKLQSVPDKPRSKNSRSKAAPVESLRDSPGLPSDAA